MEKWKSLRNKEKWELSSDKEKKEAMGLAVLAGYNYSWIRDRLLVNHYIIDNFDDFLENLLNKSGFKFRKDQKQLFLAMMQAESISLAVKYAEDLASLSIAFSQDLIALQPTLKEYKIKDIKNFYKRIVGWDFERFKKILGYPNLGEISSNDVARVKTSVNYAKLAYKQIMSFYFELSDFYNSYKHGLRVIPCISEKCEENSRVKEKEVEIICLLKRTADTTIETLDLKKYKKSLEVAGDIFTLLDVMFVNHKNQLFGVEKKPRNTVFLNPGKQEKIESRLYRQN